MDGVGNMKIKNLTNRTLRFNRSGKGKVLSASKSISITPGEGTYSIPLNSRQVVSRIVAMCEAKLIECNIPLESIKKRLDEIEKAEVEDVRNTAKPTGKAIKDGTPDKGSGKLSGQKKNKSK